LTQAERTEHLVRAEQLRASGVEIEIPKDWQEQNRPLDIIVASPRECTVYESRSGGPHYAVLARLVARSGLILTDCDITTKYDGEIVLESFRDAVCTLGGVEYCQRDVLNHHIENRLRLPCGEMVEGLILASGLARIPAEYRDGALVPFEITFTTSLGNVYGAEGRCSVSRAVQQEIPSVRRGTSLYALDATQKPRELSPSEESARRYRELLAQEKACRATKGSPATDDSR
jgi:hypothetical protein